jgi:DNA-binding MarR family transcriptional regulator
MATDFRREIRQKRPFASPEEEALLNLMRTAGVLQEEGSQLFKNEGLTGAGFNVLRVLEEDRKEGLPCSQVGERLLSRAPDVTRLLDRLEDKGLVRRARSSEDRRVVRAWITAKGSKLLSKMVPGLEAQMVSQLGHLTRKEQKELTRLLVKARGIPERS